MPETRKYETNEMVDIDNSGPEVDVTLPEEKKEEEVQTEQKDTSLWLDTGFNRQCSVAHQRQS